MRVLVNENELQRHAWSQAQRWTRVELTTIRRAYEAEKWLCQLEALATSRSEVSAPELADFIAEVLTRHDPGQG
jgi:hypothetical protein